MAASMGFKEGVHKGSPILLEPMMKVEVVVPEEYLGDVMGQIKVKIPADNVNLFLDDVLQ